MITFTKEQLSAVMCKHAEKENGLHDLLEIMLESLMVAERGEWRIQSRNATSGSIFVNNFNTSFGVAKLSIFLGLLLSLFSIVLRSSSE